MKITFSMLLAARKQAEKDMKSDPDFDNSSLKVDNFGGLF
jgi:hypothetical protein